MTGIFIKCAQCGEIYGGQHLRCPYCQCGRITPRLFWDNKDYEREKELKAQEGKA